MDINSLTQQWVDKIAPGAGTSNTEVGTGTDVDSTISSSESVSGLAEEDQSETESQEVSDSSESPEQSAAPKTSEPTKETIVVTDEQGKRRKIEIDYSDRKSLKRAVEMMHGARKWQAERDQERTAHSSTKQKMQELQQSWDTLESAFQTGGVEAVIDLIAGDKGGYKGWEKKVLERQRFLEEATPEQIEALNAKEAQERANKELARIRKENEEFRKKITEEKETAELRSLESRVNPAFDKYRFADKLGDPSDELMFDEMLWNTALKRLEPYEEQGLPLSQELVEREFRAVAASIRKRIGLQAEKKAAKAVDQKKREATENVQAKLKSGYKSDGGSAAKANDMLASGNLKGIFANWGALGNAFSKK